MRMLWCRFQNGGTAVLWDRRRRQRHRGRRRSVFGVHAARRNPSRSARSSCWCPWCRRRSMPSARTTRTTSIGRAKVKGSAPKFYERPRVGYRANSALIPTGEEIVKPKDAGPQLRIRGRDRRGRSARPCRNVSPQEATAGIFGWTIGNDVTERDWQKNDPTNLRAKNADTFKPMGPFIATGIEPRDMTTNVRLNGETVHSFPTGNMLFSAGEVISDISRTNTLSPGDVVWLGTDEVPQSAQCPATRSRSRSPASACCAIRRGGRAESDRRASDATTFAFRCPAGCVRAVLARGGIVARDRPQDKFPSRADPHRARRLRRARSRTFRSAFSPNGSARGSAPRSSSRTSRPAAAWPRRKAVITSPPDGHTLALLSNATAVSAALFKKLPYDPIADFMPIGRHQRLSPISS